MLDQITRLLATLAPSVMVALIAKSTVAILIGLVLLAIVRRASAAFRHLLLIQLFGFLILLPLLTLAPEKRIAVPWVPPAAETEVSIDMANVAPASAGGARSIGPMSAPRSNWRADVRNLFVIGIALGTLSIVAGLFRLRRYRQSAVVWLSPLVDAVRIDAGVRRPVQVLHSPDIAVPLTYGLRRPTILLPLESDRWSEREVVAALVHEMEHVRRGDWAVQMVARAIAVVYWANPLVWVALRRLALEAERASDDAVVRRSERPAFYAEQLVTLARQARSHSLPALAMATRSNLAQRIESILDSTQRRGGRTMRHSLAALITVVSIAVFIGPLRLVGAERIYPHDGRSVSEDGGASEIEQGVQGGVEDGVQGGVRGGISDGISGALDSPLATAMIEAARDGRTDHIRQLLDSGVSPNVVSDGDGTALIAAANEGHLEVVRLLLDRGANPNLGVRGDGNPLISAADEGNLEIVKLLLDAGADVNGAVSGDGSALIAAAREGHADVVELLLDRGAKIDQVVPSDENALIQASWKGRADVVSLLIARGADINAQVWANPTADNSRGELRTPLIMARRGRHSRVVDILLQAGATR